MYKKLIQLVLLALFTQVSLYAKSIVVITDISQGITKEEGIEVMSLIDPKKSPIYEDDDKFYGYVFSEKGRQKTIGKFVDRSTDRRLYNNFYKKQYASYFNVVKVGVKQTIKKKSVAQKDIVFLIDTSGSMKKDDIQSAIKESLNRTVAKKGEKVNIAIVTFDGHKSFEKADNSRIVLSFTSDASSITRAIDSIELTNMNTLLADGLELSIDILKKRKTKSKMIILISDGDDIYDEKKALKSITVAKQNKISVKPFALGGANLSNLKKFSTNRKVYDITSSDVDNVILPLKSEHKDTIFQNLASLSSDVFKKNKSKDSVLIIYSTMIENSNLYDFNMVPNLSDDLFYNEVKEKLKDEHLDIDFHGLKTYVRLTGSPSAQKENELRIFWQRFIEEHNGKEVWISKDKLTLDEMGQ